MKKLLIVFLLFVCLFAFAGCGECEHQYGDADPCGDRECTLCGHIEKGDHAYEVISLTEPTLILSGQKIERCTKCGERVRTKLEKITPADLDMPAVYVTDYVSGAIPTDMLYKEHGEILVKLKYESNTDAVENFECITRIKVQGASSAQYDKRNYTVKFYTDESLTTKLKVDLGWGTENQYCLKANYVDSSHARNIVGARLSAMVAASRENIDENLAASPNYGLIDGYPVLMYINGKFHGLYTLNIPKDHWMFGMRGSEETKKQAIIMGAYWTESVRMAERIGYSLEGSGWDMEHCSTKDTRWVKESFNKLIETLSIKDKQRLRAELPKYLDIDAAIDNMLLVYTLNAADNVSKNTLWATFDGTKWIPSMYDMDATFGMFWDGIPVDEVNANSVYPSLDSGSFGLDQHASKMFYVLLKYYPDEVESRWKSLRETVITMENIEKLFEDFFSLIPEEAFEGEDAKWKDIPHAKENRTNMYEATEKQLERLDEFFYNFNK